MTLNRFFSHLSDCRRGLLMLDYDGTIAPFTNDRMRAFPVPEILDLLLEIEALGTTRIVIVTGRPCREIPLLMKLRNKIEIWGCHGREHEDLKGTLRCFGVTARDAELLGEAHRRMAAFAGERYVDSKTGCCAVHWRPLSPERREEVREHAMIIWREFVEQHGMAIDLFDGGIELSVPGRTKGDSVAALMEDVDPARVAAAFLGDDMTDENGFRVLKGKGLCVLVKNHERETLADVRITLPEGVIDFLRRWRDVTSRPEEEALSQLEPVEGVRAQRDQVG